MTLRHPSTPAAKRQIARTMVAFEVQSGVIRNAPAKGRQIGRQSDGAKPAISPVSGQRFSGVTLLTDSIVRRGKSRGRPLSGRFFGVVLVRQPTCARPAARISAIARALRKTTSRDSPLDPPHGAGQTSQPMPSRAGFNRGAGKLIRPMPHAPKGSSLAFIFGGNGVTGCVWRCGHMPKADWCG